MTTSAHTNNLRKRLSLFTFSLNETSKHDSSSENQDHEEEELEPPHQGNNQLSSPINSPVSQSSSQLPENNIFERSVQDTGVLEQCPLPKCSKCSHSQKKSCSHNSSISLASGGLFIKNEDMIPAALDASTSLFNDSQTNLDQVEMIYPNRRSSSVLSLNMALGRQYSPSRKNSTYTIKHQIPQSPSSNININGNNNNNNNMNNLTNNLTNNPTNAQGLNSPPKLMSSRSSLSFYSYADMISTDEYTRRPSIKHSITSQGFVPLSKSSFQRVPSFVKHKPTNSQLSSQLEDREDTKGLQKFLISPESSDDEQENTSLKSKRKSVSSSNSNNVINDNESLISSSVGDCIRRTTTEINGN